MRRELGWWAPLRAFDAWYRSGVEELLAGYRSHSITECRGQAGRSPGSMRADTFVGMGDWWADVAGQVLAGFVVVVLVAVVTALTPWGKRTGKAMLRPARSVLRALASLRVTTQRRIDAQISSAVAHAVASVQESQEDDGEGRPLRPEDYDGWVMEPAPEPKTWLLRNQTRETAMVINIWPATNHFPFDWEPPEFPITLAPRESVSFPAVKLRSGYSLMPFMESTMANVFWEDTHGDQHEDIIWVVT